MIGNRGVVASWSLAPMLALSLALSPLSQAAQSPQDTGVATRIKSLEQRVAQLERNTQPELGDQMMLLEMRHDRLWWAAQAGNWNLAYYMAGEMGEAIHGIVETNGEAAELQPQKLSEIMPEMLNGPLQGVMDAIGTHDGKKFAKAYDDLSAACTGCHRVAGNTMLIIQRPRTPLLDDLRYEPEGH